jgi:DNA polymerase-3 subunit epsilon
VVCNDTAPEQGKGYHALQLGVPVVSDAQFMDNVGAVVGGRNMEQFADTRMVEEQFALF